MSDYSPYARVGRAFLTAAFCLRPGWQPSVAFSEFTFIRFESFERILILVRDTSS
jgi:hypothetical protein